MNKKFKITSYLFKKPMSDRSTLSNQPSNLRFRSVFVFCLTLAMGIFLFAAGNSNVLSGLGFGASVEVSPLAPPLPTCVVNLGPDLTICPGDTIFLDATNVGATYTWQDGFGGPIYAVTDTGLYWVTVDDGICQQTDSIYIGLGALLVVAGPDTTVCAGDSVQLNVIVTGGPGNYVYNWSPQAGLSCFTCPDPMAAPAVSTTYTCSVTDTTGGGGGAGGGIVYLRSTSGPPWGQNRNETILTAAFGAGAWQDLRYQTVIPSLIFIPANCMIILEGGDANANAMNTFIQANIAIMEAWVAQGGALFINGAPNQGGNINYGFGGVTLNYAGGPYLGAVDVVAGTFAFGPNLPAGTAYTGNFYTHGFITGPGLTTLIQNQNAPFQIGLAEKAWGSGIVMFGAMTTTNWHNPQPNADNLRRNMWEYLYGTCGAGCNGQDDVTITINPLPLITITGLESGYCESDPVDTAIVSPPGGVLTGPGLTGNIFDPAVAGQGVHNIIYTYTDPIGCTNTDTFQVNISPDPGVVDAGNDTVICGGQCINLSPTVTGVGNWAYLWTPATGLNNANIANPVACPAVTTTYHVTVFDSAAGGGGGGGGGVVYLRSNGGQPWGQNTNENALNAEFGVGAWQDLRYQTVVPATVFSPQNCLVVMEGGDNNANAMNTFIQANIAAMEAWVSQGGSLFLNGAPNQGAAINCGFGGVTLNYPGPFIGSVDVVAGTFAFGPTLPAGTAFTGNWFTHTDVTGPGLTALIQNANAPFEMCLAEKNWGNGLVWIGGMTTTNWHAPLPNGHNLRQNMFNYLYSQCGGPGCVQEDSITITVIANAAVTFTGLQTDYCSGDPADTLIGIPAGGVFTGPGMTGDIFDPFVAGNGTHEIIYTYTAAGCVAADTQTVQVLADPGIVTAGPDTTVCDSQCVQLFAGVTGAGNFTYVWSPATGLNNPGIANPIACPTATTTYTVTVYDSTALGGGGGQGGIVYLRSTVGAPWGQNRNETLLTASFGAANWQDLRYETCNPATVFSQSNCMVILEGGDNNANEMNTFLQANLPAMEAWVTAGGALMINGAPNEGGNINYGFGGVTLNYAGGPYANNVDVIAGPFWAGPNLPAGTAFAGNFFTHGYITGPGLTTLIQDQVGPFRIGLAEKSWGNGLVLFGSMTTPNWHNPQPNADNLSRNIYEYLYGQCTQITCVRMDSVTITVVPAPIINISGLSPSYCNFDPTDTAQATPAGGIWGGMGMVDSIFDPSLLTPGTHYITYTYTNPTGCTASDSVAIVIVPDPGILTLPNDTAICLGDSAQLNVAVQGVGGFMYEWTPALGLNNPFIPNPKAAPGVTTTYTVTVTDSGGGGTGATGVVYLRSQSGPPWGSSSNEQALDAVFGAGNWQDLRYETVNVASILTNQNCLIVMEGGDGTANALNTFLTANLPAIENWVASGGALFITAAPNQGGNINFGFGGVWLNYAVGPYTSNAVVVGGHPIATGPFLPAGLNFSGNFYTHGNITGPGLTTVIENQANPLEIGLAEKTWGSGLVMFGSMTTTNFHTPAPNGTNLRQNMFAYLAASCQAAIGCSSTDSMTVIVSGPIVANITNVTDVLCAWDSTGTATAAGAGGFNPYTFVWDTNPMQFTQTAVGLPPGTYTVFVTDSVGCMDSTQATIGITVNPIVPNLGPDTTACDGDTLVLWHQIVGATGYLWNTGGTDSTLEVTQTGTYWVEVNVNGCAFFDSINVFFNPNPIVNLGNDTTLCDGETLLLDATDPSVVAYLWQDNTVNPTLTVSTPGGTYWVIVTDGNGCMGYDSIVVNYNPLPIVNLGNDTTLCDGETLFLDVTQPGGTYLWNDGLAVPTRTVATPGGLYWVDVTLLGCTTRDTIVVNFNPIPYFSLGADTALCDGDVLTLDATTPGATYLWDDLSFGPTRNVTTTGTYGVTVTLNGCEWTDSIDVIFNPMPVVNLGADTTLCDGETLFLDATQAGATYLWNDGLVVPTRTVVTPGGLFWVDVTILGCTTRDTIVVNFNPIPYFSLGADTALCDGDILVLDATTPGATYLWDDNSFGPTRNVTTTGTYGVTVTLNGCEWTDSINVLFYPIPVVVLPADTTLCDGETLVLDATQAGATYLWDDGSTGATLTVTGAGIYNVWVTINGCTGTDQVVVNYNPIPQPNLGPDQAICFGTNTTLDPGLAGATDWLWSTGATTPTLTVNTQGNYWVAVTVGGCVGYDTVFVGVYPQPIVNLGADRDLCDGDTVFLDVTTPGATYLWQDNTTNPTFTVTQSGTYTVAVTVPGCPPVVGSMVATYYPYPIVDLGPDSAICLVDSVYLDAGFRPGANYLWNDGSTNYFNWATHPGVYNVAVAENGCVTYESLLFNAIPDPVVDLGPDSTHCPGDQIVLNAYFPPGATYLWNDGTTSHVITVTQPGVYYVDVTNECGVAQDTIEFIQPPNCGCQIFAPTAFTPNGDGLNDVFHPVCNCQFLDYNFRIFNRWGEIVYESNDPNAGWEGFFHNKLIQSGVYVWKLDYRADREGKVISDITAGTVTLLR